MPLTGTVVAIREAAEKFIRFMNRSDRFPFYTLYAIVTDWAQVGMVNLTSVLGIGIANLLLLFYVEDSRLRNGQRWREDEMENR